MTGAVYFHICFESICDPTTEKNLFWSNIEQKIGQSDYSI